jgi:hypothetical protein
LVNVVLKGGKEEMGCVGEEIWGLLCFRALVCVWV